MKSAGRTGKTEGPAGKPGRRGRGFSQVAGSARTTLETVGHRHGFAETQVLTRWPDVVGAELSRLCHPVKVSYARSPGLGATLVLSADGAVAPQVEHLGPRIIERVNAHYGYRAVSRIRIVQTGAAGMAEAQAPFAHAAPARPARGEPRPPAPQTPEAQASAADLVARIRDPELRAALGELGAYILSRPDRAPKG